MRREGVSSRRRAASRLRCAYCREDIGEAPQQCELCGVVLHGDCRAELRGCPTLGCGHQALVAERPKLRHGPLEMPDLTKRAMVALSLPMLGLVAYEIPQLAPGNAAWAFGLLALIVGAQLGAVLMLRGRA